MVGLNLSVSVNENDYCAVIKYVLKNVQIKILTNCLLDII